jgi:hypothetical protein
MTTDALGALLPGPAALLDGAGPSTDDDIGRVILVTNERVAETDWALSEPWPYHLPGGTDRYLTVSVHGMSDAATTFEHGISHQFGLIDLFAYPGVSSPTPFADGWDNMAHPFNGVHPLLWSKERASWASAQRRNLLFIPRPARGVTYSTGSRPLPLYPQSTAAASQPVGIAIGLTHRVGTLTEETAFYYLEARSNRALNSDAALPGSGVLLYYVNERIPQGQGPLVIQDHGAMPGLADAAIPASGSATVLGGGLSVSVQAGPTGGPTYLINLTYTAPLTDYDVSITTGDPSWTSPDIWVDNPSDGFDLEMGREPTDRGDIAIGDEENRIYARIHNAGAEAFDAELAFFITEPFPAVGEADFTLLESIPIGRIPAGDTIRYVSWRPTVRSTHSCVRVVVRRLTDDRNPANNAAQQNIDVTWSRRGSPYAPVRSTYQITNTTAVEKLVYFRLDELPSGWTYRLEPEKAVISPGERFIGSVIITPTPDAPNCTAQDLDITAWSPAGHTLIRLGGVTVRVNLANKAEMKYTLDTLKCQDQLYTKLLERQGGDLNVQTYFNGKSITGIPRNPFMGDNLTLPSANELQKANPLCAVLHPKGCTTPSQPGEQIVLRYHSPRGPSVYRTIQTDSNGCFEDVYPVAESGPWEVTAAIAGNKCLAPIVASTKVVVGATNQPNTKNSHPAMKK